jgi:hypothetical protein
VVLQVAPWLCETLRERPKFENLDFGVEFKGWGQRRKVGCRVGDLLFSCFWGFCWPTPVSTADRGGGWWWNGHFVIFFVTVRHRCRFKV